MLFSLIVATKGRIAQLDLFLSSIDKQTYRKFEVIVVDQNQDGCLDLCIGKFNEKFKILHLKSEPGLSKARNLGLQYINGDIIAFPDDDCMYFPNTLQNVFDIFRKNKNLGGITGQPIDHSGSNSMGDYPKKEKKINIYNVWHTSVSFTIFLKKSTINKVGVFDENLGVGSGTPWQSGEETDYLIRMININKVLYYYPKVAVYHPNPLLNYNKAAFNRAYKYSPGCGYVLDKNKYSIWFVFAAVLQPLIKSFVTLITGKKGECRYYIITFVGRIWGILASKS